MDGEDRTGAASDRKLLHVISSDHFYKTNYIYINKVWTV